MSPRSTVNRTHVVEHIAALAPDEDTSTSVREVFLPLSTHRLALRPEVVVVQGTRGAGKTALFRVLQELGPRARDFFEDAAIPTATWVDAYSENKMEHPAASVLDALGDGLPPERDAALRAFWATHLLVRLSEEKVANATLPPPVKEARTADPANPLTWIDVAEKNIGPILAALDAVERSLSQSGRLVFASYDHLDRLGVLATTRTIRERFVRTLLSLWLSMAGRYRHLRGKIFLRPDLFDEAEAGFPDASKLRSRAVLLTWDVASLYRLTVRHLANRGPHLDAALEWLGANGPELKTHSADASFGLLPGEMGTPGQARFAKALAGETMGSGAKKGYTYRWIPARLRDAGGAIVPRSFLRLLRHAAEDTLQDGVATSGPLMDPTRLVGALRVTSEDRVTELQEEYPFVRRLENLSQQHLLMERPVVVSLLSKPTSPNDGYGTKGNAVFDELLRIGVIDVRGDGRIDVPDIYRYGYGIKRKGGAKTPR